MPSSTFFRLPAAKRDRLLEAARAEFSRTAYGETSINRIIRQAGIPRGSFYMYFHGKDDLFLYMMRAYGERLEQRMGELLEQSGGDLFAAFLALFEHVQAHWQQEQYQDLARMLRLNGNLKPDIFLCSTGEAIAARLRDKIDLSALNLREEGDLAGILGLLVMVTGEAIMSAASGGGPAVRARLVHSFEILKRGMAKAAPLEKA